VPGAEQELAVEVGDVDGVEVDLAKKKQRRLKKRLRDRWVSTGSID